MKILLVGDVHGKFGEYAKIVEDHHNNHDMIFQVGDFGLGFHQGIDLLIQSYQSQNSRSFFIRGNHDDPAVCRETAGYVDDGHMMLNGKIMFVGGAWSIDWMMRTEGVNWWSDEECSISKLNDLYDQYVKVKPEIMITHTCPTSVAKRMFVDTGNALGTEMHNSRTEQCFEEMWRIHQPKHWVFGHWHYDDTRVYNGTMFTCLDELSVMTLEI
jgi:Icc-related predicted phosphoesterase